MNKSLYCYFGALGTMNTLDIPGHTFYQLPLLEATAQYLSIEKKFDFFSYVPSGLFNRIESKSIDFHADAIGSELSRMYDSMIDYGGLILDEVIANIEEKQYQKIILKARFRNLSTLTKKWKDAHMFETIISTALSSGYDPNDIVILDTDLSLSDSFLNWAIEIGLNVLIPSIAYAPMTKERANVFLEILSTSNEFFNAVNDVVYYGNVSTSNYKAGHSKNSIILDCITETQNLIHYGNKPNIVIAGKFDKTSVPNLDYLRIIDRSDRNAIWNAMQYSKMCLNVSKDLYCTTGFIPARVYEAIMLGQIPISFNMPKIHPALSFTTVDEYVEIVKFLMDLGQADIMNLRRQVVDHLLG